MPARTRTYRHQRFVIDGEAVVLGVDGVADFSALRSRRHDEHCSFMPSDILALNGEDLRSLPLSTRKTHLARLLARRQDWIFVAPFEQGEIGPDLFRTEFLLTLLSLRMSAIGPRLSNPQ